MEIIGTSRSRFSPRGAERLALVAEDLVQHLAAEVGKGFPADVALARFFKAHHELGSRDRRFLSELSFSFFRWRGWLDSIAIENPRRAFAIAYYLDATTEHPAAEVLARDSFPSPQPLGDASLDNKARAVSTWMGGAKLNVEMLLPEWVRGAIPASDHPDDCFQRCVDSFQRRPPTWLHLLAGRESSVLRALDQADVRATQHAHIPGAASVPGSSPLRSLPADIRAGFLVQDLASQCVALACAPNAGEHWWDVCAGSGGKSLHLADLMRDSGKVMAGDIRSGILDELRRRAREAGLRSVRVGKPTSDTRFDGVLVDAPCSGLGTWSRNPDARWRTAASTLVERARIQTELLTSAAQHVRPGGVLVYSVCTLTTVETAAVVAAFLAKDARFMSEPWKNPLVPDAAPAACQWIWPWDGPCDGMFVARFRRTPT